MTIIEKIKETENKAASIISEAEKEVLILIDTTKAEAIKNQQLRLEKAKDEIQAMHQDTLDKISQTERMKLSECAKLNQLDEQTATKNQEKVISFIIKKVIES